MGNKKRYFPLKISILFFVAGGLALLGIALHFMPVTDGIMAARMLGKDGHSYILEPNNIGINIGIELGVFGGGASIVWAIMCFCRAKPAGILGIISSVFYMPIGIFWFMVAVSNGTYAFKTPGGVTVVPFLMFALAIAYPVLSVFQLLSRKALDKARYDKCHDPSDAPTETEIKKKQHAFIDGTAVCPKCGARMSVFRYRKAAIGNVSTSTDWAAMKKTTRWTETTYGKGSGYMCRECYKKRQLIFWLIFGTIFLGLVALIVVGAILQIQWMWITGAGIIALTVIFSISKSGRELFDLFSFISCKLSPEQEFIHYMIVDHPELFNKNDRIYPE